MSTLLVGEPVAVRRFDGSETQWDAAVRRAEGGTFCHLAGWRSVMRDAMGHDPCFLAATDAAGEITGVLPLVHVRTRLFGQFLVSMPFLNAGGPLGTATAREALLAAALDEARRSRADLLELRTRDACPGPLTPLVRKVTVLLELPTSPDALWRRFAPKLRSQIRRPQKEGMIARFGPELLPHFYDVFARTMHALGTPVMPRRFFEMVLRSFPELVVCGVVFRGVTPVAAGLGFVWKEEFELTWAGALRRERARAPNMLLYWSFLQAMIDRGVRVFNFGRCTPGGGTHRFKRQWGGVDVSLPWLAWSPRGSTVPTTERPLFRVAAACWRRLPLRIANALGPAVVRGLP